MKSSTIPQILYDVWNNFGQPLRVSPSGDLDLCSGSVRSEQRVLKRLLTSINGYIWHAEYGAGLPSFIGQSLNQDNFDQIRSLILSNMFLEDSVSQIPPPKIFIQPISNGVFVQIEYVENPSLNPIVINFNVSI